ncbi:8-oxo-dGTP pyrophosphatase MutT (NUDIX family) [Neobacillus niacini]|uniref:NUDIX hydrolase n=1 Tax=Neobacillus niacini TaxID=86668 RepID=UPI00277D4843|nr:NUDIX hydrolase [Neobacillus niacini]MDQ1002169.1 8-oxo-dGTP pyrophosphatase MutT (NUDIX family) [Neobacillus niacini]
MVAVPKPASTVVLMDDSRVYLTKRPTSMKFLGGYHVFPGGAIEERDQNINRNYVNTEGTEASLTPAHYIGAARELYEEVGVLLGTKKDGTPVRIPKENELQYRKQLLNREISFSQLLENEELNFNIQCLTYFGQIITPENHPIRFDTRFFLAKLPQGQYPSPDQTEIEGADWYSPDEAINALRNKKIRLAPPTILTLKTIMNYQKGGTLRMKVTKDDISTLIQKLRAFWNE